MRGLNFYKRLLSILCVAVMLVPFVTLSASALGVMRTVRVGYFGFDGYHDVDADGNRSGYGYEYLHEMAKYTGWNFEYISGTWDECQDMLMSGEIDLLTSAQRTPEREEAFDFSELPMGESYAQLTVKGDNTHFIRNDFANFQNMRIGILDGNSRNASLTDFAQEKAFTYQTVTFDSAEKLTTALQSGVVDAILTSSLRKLSDERIIAQFAPSPYYCLVKKGNTELMSEINAAMAEIEMKNPAYKFDLYEEYYRSSLSETISLTKEEDEYLKNHHTLRVVARSASYPLFYHSGTTAKGIAVDIIELITSELGIKAEYIQATSYEQAIQMVQSGQADVIARFESDYNLAEHNDLKITSPYLSISYNAVTRPQFVGDFKNIVIVTGNYMNEKHIRATYPKSNIIMVTNEEDAVRAVDDKTADVAFINTYSAQALLFLQYPNLRTSLVDGQTSAVSLGVSETVSPLLYTILDRKISSLDAVKVSQIVTDHTILQEYHLTLLQYAKQNPATTILILAALFLAIIAVLLYMAISNKKHADKVFDLAYYDNLTKIWNSNGFTFAVTAKLLHQTSSENHAIISLDVDGFSSVNDDYGRASGDATIIEISRQLTRCCGNNSIVAHSHADNFLIWVNFTTQRDLDLILNGICSAMQFFTENNFLLKLSVRMGVYASQAVDAQSLLTAIDHARTAHQIAKQKDSNIVYFDDKLEARIRHEKEIVDYFDRALQLGEFVVYYQPKFDMRDGSIIGAEALVRWIHTDLGFLSPAEFIPLLEKTGDVVELDFFVLEQVCILIKDWVVTGHPITPISVNQSRAHFKNPEYISRLQSLMVKYDVPRDVIELEITESLFEDNSVSSDLIKKMQMLGFFISVDDFGSGYSSLYLLNQVSIDTLKIDKSLIDDSESAIKVRKIVRKIVEMAYDIGLEVICEGVEHQGQVDFLLEIGCIYAQGFLYSKPIPHEDFLKLLESHVAAAANNDTL